MSEDAPHYQVTAICEAPQRQVGGDIKEMSLNEYQKHALETAIYPQPIINPALGLCGESGDCLLYTSDAADD